MYLRKVSTENSTDIYFRTRENVLVVVLGERECSSSCRYRTQKYPAEISLENSDFIVALKTTSDGVDFDMLE